MNLPKIYEPNQYEADIYALWESSGAFKPSGKGKPYSIVMPPPNANGNLHLGHALGNAVQDGLIRYHRMKGDRVVYIPGADHAGFETWVVYERQLEKNGRSRFNFTRDELYNQTWDFVAKHRGNMEIQLRELGASCDWTKQVFTLDQTVVDVAYDTFKKMWNDDLIYRGKRLVNYCTKHQTGFADIEVEYKNEKSFMWEIRYPLTDGSGDIIVATTRPETMLGDSAVAVNPKDARYKKLIGKSVTLPLVETVIPIIADEMVDYEFGTGAVKITPAHDPNDFEVGERHNLKRPSVISFEGLISDEAPQKYRGLSVNEARSAILKDLEEGDYLLNQTKYEHSVGHCYKCGTVIQPLLMDQWFIRVEKLAKTAVKAIEEGEIQFIPENKGRVAVNYLKKLKDWNISRQIPWGIPIPAFVNVDDPTDWIYDEHVQEEEITKNGKTYARDPDTFDTWFSSGQWPFITTKFHSSGELAEFFPTSVMETGHDILFQWVCRMIMLSKYREESIPFKNVYLHGLVLDPEGQKMSKSKGNVINPQEIMEEFGSDALRLGLLASRSAGQNQAFGKDKVVAGRNFCNKLWNIARYIEGVAGDSFELRTPRPQTPADHWIIRELDAAASNVATMLEEYRFSEAFETVYHTIWDKMADWYLEASKTAPEPSVMVWALEMCLKVAHPFAPFVTETIWQTLKWEESQIITSEWPRRTAYNADQAALFEQLQAVITETREVLSTIESTDIALITKSSRVVLENHQIIQQMTRIGLIEKLDQSASQSSGLRLTSVTDEIWLDLSEDDLQLYKSKLEKRLANVDASVHALEHRLSNQAYVANAPKALVEESRTELQAATTQAEHLRHQLKRL